MQTLGAPLYIAPRFSPTALISLSLIYCGALSLVWVLTLPAMLAPALSLLLVSDAWRNIQRHVFYRHPWLTSEWQFIQGYVLLANNIEAHPTAHCLVHPWLVVVNLRTPNGRHASRIFFADSLDSITFRRLRVRLRHPIEDNVAMPSILPWYTQAIQFVVNIHRVLKTLVDKI